MRSISKGVFKQVEQLVKKKIFRILRRVLFCIGTLLLYVLVITYLCGALCCYGPSEAARDLFVNSMLETSAAKFVPYLYFSKSRIQEITGENRVIRSEEITDPEIIVFATPSPKSSSANTAAPSPTKHGTTSEPPATPTSIPSPSPKREYGASKISEEDGIELYEIKTQLYNGNLMIIHDPSRVTIGMSHPEYHRDKPGVTLPEIAERYCAVAAINGGGFEDDGGMGTGCAPSGLVISNGALKWGSLNSEYELVGFTQNNVLVVGYMSGKKAFDMGIRDALCYGPTLIVNGEKVEMSGYGSGVNPRTAIGQRRDGAILLLVINGRQLSSLGATYSDLATILWDFGAVNAANLDGGTSTAMYYKGKIVNQILRLRKLPTAIVVMQSTEGKGSHG